jgi:UDP:flavonoid glycosyltransferase YjiC (YdhE family)
MRVLFVTWAWPTHLFPMVPLAWALRAQGHDVRVASQPALTEAIPRTGLPAVSVGGDVDVVARLRQIAAAPAKPGKPRPGSTPRAAAMFAELAEAMLPDLVAFGRRWHPDLVVFEPTAYAGPIAAAALGVPAVRYLYGPDIMAAPVFRDAEQELLAPLWEKYGLAAVDTAGDLTLDPCPAGLQVDEPLGPRQPVQYVPYNGFGTGLPPEWSSGRATRPRVCVTWGTTYGRLDPAYFLLPEVLTALSTLDVEVVAAITTAQRELLTDLPDGVRVAESVPLYRLLPACDAVVSHGGVGTSMTSLASAGLPLLMTPRLPDHRFHAARVAAAGAGRVLPLTEFTPSAIRGEVGALLDQLSYRTEAIQLRKEMLAQPAPAELVPVLRELASSAR